MDAFHKELSQANHHPTAACCNIPCRTITLAPWVRRQQSLSLSECKDVMQCGAYLRPCVQLHVLAWLCHASRLALEAFR